MQITNLQVNHLTAPIGIDVNNTALHWTLADGLAQTGFAVRVEKKNGADQKEDVFSSGKIDSTEMGYRLPVKLALKSSYTIYVMVWDEAGIETEEAGICVITGKSRDDWSAKWINPELIPPVEKERRAGYLKKEFFVDGEALQKGERAYLYATCHGLMNISINGKEITDHQLLPGTQQYDRRLMVETVDVTGFLTNGRNEILVSLGDGWYRGSMGNSQVKNIYGEDIAFLAELELGGRLILKTDEGWQASGNGPIGRNDFMFGEEYDARKEQITDWHEVKVEDFGYENLISRDTPAVLPKETFRPVLITTPAGERVFDFGQNLVGYVCLDFEAKAGQKIVLSHGEVLDEHGNFTTANFQNPRLPMTQDIIYTCKDGRNQYHPTKTYMGFRYVKAEMDDDAVLDESNLTAVAIYSDMRQTGFFECGNEEVNQLFRNAVWSMKGNFVDVPTDCPTREKSGYSGDCQAYVHTAMYLMDCYPVYAKWIREQAAGQYEDGVVPQIAPKANKPGEKEKLVGMFEMDGGIGWSDSFEIVPYRLWKRYGDRSLLEENYEAIRRWTEYEIARAKNTREVNYDLIPEKYREFTIDTEFMWGEWLEPGQGMEYMSEILKKGDAEVGTAFFYMHLRYVQEMAEALGKKEDEKRWGTLAEKVKEAYRAIFLENGKIKEEKRQCRYVRPIAHDLLTEEEKQKAAADLAKLIEQNRDHLNTGFLSTHELPRALSRNGQSKKAYDLLLQREMPGWLYAVTKGCTTIPERWDCFDENGAPKDSFNHYSYGAICGWLMDSVCGIQVSDGSIRLAPVPDERLGHASAVYDSPYGKIASSWEYRDGKFRYRFEIPANMTAEICLPGQEAKAVHAGVYRFE